MSPTSLDEIDPAMTTEPTNANPTPYNPTRAAMMPPASLAATLEFLARLPENRLALLRGHLRAGSLELCPCGTHLVGKEYAHMERTLATPDNTAEGISPCFRRAAART